MPAGTDDDSGWMDDLPADHPPLCPVLLLLLSSSVRSNSLRPHRLQYTRLPCPSPSPGVCSNSCQRCHLTISSSVIPLFLLPSVFPSIRIFSNELALRIKWPKYWSFSFSISPSDEYLGLISFRIDWFDLLAVQGDSQESSLAPPFESINS